ncbi:MAG TPA: ATP-binding protein [Planctomycetota bacterium]|nr:ATP-binding protein [Planctomycetota bacterium]
MRFLFQPAIAVMNRMNFVLKFIFIGLLLLLPFAYVTHLMAKSADQQIVFNQKESYGIQYIVLGSRMLSHLQDCRTYEAGILGGEASLTEALDREKQQADLLIPLIDAVDSKYREDLKTADGKYGCTRRWNEIKEGWTKVRLQGSAKGEADLKAYTDLCSLVTDWILNYVGNYSNLILDPDLDSYWLMDAFVAKAPQIAEILAQTCMGSLKYTVPEGGVSGAQRPRSPTMAERLTLAGLEARAQDLLDGLVQVNLKTAYEFNGLKHGSVKARLDGLASQATARCHEFLAFESEWIINSEDPAVKQGDLVKRGQAAADALYAFYEAVAPVLDELILARVAAYRSDKTLGMIAAETATFLHIYLFIAFYIAVHASVAKIHHFTQRMIQGTTEHFRLDSRDELGKVAGLYNGINETLNQTRALKAQVESQAQDLRLSEARFRLLSEEAPIGILQWDTRGACIFANSRWQSLSGRLDSECAGDQWIQAIHPDDRPGMVEEWRRIGAERTSLDQELRIQDAKGTVRWVRIHIAPLVSSGGVFTGFVGTIEDVSARKQAEEDRALREIQLRQAHKLESVGQLAAGIAHEINTPIQYVGDNIRFLGDAFNSMGKVFKGYERFKEVGVNGAADPGSARELEATLEEADMDYLGQEVPKAIRQSLEGVERVTTIVRAMKEFSHPGSDEKTMVDLRRAIETTVTVARNEWKFVADVVMDLDPGLPLVPALPGDLNQVILNLIVNAAHAIADVVGKSGERKGTITISARKDGEWAEVRIRDTGTGIPEHVRHRLFEPFFTTKPVGKGTGQGLALSHGVIVKKHGGSLAFETEVGHGTTFVVRLPLTAEMVQDRS